MPLSGSHNVGDPNFIDWANLVDTTIGALQGAATSEATARAAGDTAAVATAAADATSKANAAQAASQPLDADLTTIGGLNSAAVGVIVSDGAGWLSKNVAAFKTWLGLTKSDVGLGSVDNTADTAKPVSTAQQTALDLKANLASPALTGTPTAPTATAGTNTTQVATTAFVTAATGTSSQFTDKGSWVTSTAYAVGDVVTQNGQRYIAKTAHTSGTFVTDLAAAKWVILESALVDRSTWAATTAYAVNDVFTINGTRRVVKIAYTSGGTYGATDTTNTVLVGGNMDSATAPAAGQVYTYDAASGLIKPQTGLKFDAQRSLYNAKASNQRKARVALAKARAGTGICRALVIGDSIMAGGTAGTGGTRNGTSPPARLEAALIALGIARYSTGQVIRKQATNTGIPDTRYTEASVGAVGQGVTYDAVKDGTATFTPGFTTDRLVVRYYDKSYNGTYSVDSNGSETQSEAANAANTGVIVTKTWSFTRGSNVYHLIPPTTASGKLLALISVEAYDSTLGGGLAVTNGGWPGATTTTVNDGAGTAEFKKWFDSVAPDITIIALGTNDYSGTLGLSTFDANMATLITNAKVTGDVFLSAPHPRQDLGTVATPNLAAYIAQLYTRADTSDVPMLDMTDRWGTYALVPSLYADGLHLSAAGSQDEGGAFANLFTS